MQFIDLKHQYSLMDNEIKAAIEGVLNHGQYIMGPEIAELEKKLADYVGVKHCISMSSGTDALMLALMALDIGPGDEVITTPFTFVATVEVIALLGAKAVLVDICPKTYNMDPDLIEKAITSRTRAIMPVDLYGQCANYEKINAIAKKHQLPVIADAAQSFGAEYHGKKACAVADIGCTSFFPSKPLGCYGDGGACFTNNDDYAKAMKELRVHGQEKRYYHTRVGVNARLDTLQAAILLVKFNYFKEEVELRQQVAHAYESRLKGHLQTPFIAEGNKSVFGQYTIRTKQRGQLQEQLKAKNIPFAVHYPIPVHLQPAFQDICRISGNLAHSEAAANEVMSLPFHPYMTKAQVNEVCDALLTEDVTV